MPRYTYRERQQINRRAAHKHPDSTARLIESLQSLTIKEPGRPAIPPEQLQDTDELVVAAAAPCHFPHGGETPGAAKLATCHITRVPAEILHHILSYTLAHPTWIHVNPVFDAPNKHHLDSTLNYSVLHASVPLYNAGIEMYYSLNRFCIDLSLFSEERAHGRMDSWPEDCGLPIALSCVHKVVLQGHGTARGMMDAVRVLSAFDKLVEIGLDVRCVGQALDEEDLIKINVPEGPATKLKNAIEGAGKVWDWDKLLQGGIWMGTDEWKSWQEPEKQIEDEVDRMIAGWEEWKNPKPREEEEYEGVRWM